MKRAAIDRVYVPEFFSNRELEEKDQVTVEVSLATIKEKEQFSKIKTRKGGVVEMDNKQYLALRKKVTKISNYFDEKGKAIDTADKLIEDMEAGAGESIELAVELWNVIMGYSSKNEDSDDSEDFTEGEE